MRSRLRAGHAAILGDVVQMHQLVMNLCMNAVQAMTKPGLLNVSLWTAVVQQSRQATVGIVGPGAWIVLRVADQGIGMTPEIQDRIFDPFFTTKEMGVGTGLGLPMVLRIVAQAEGAIDVASSPGMGSMFTVYLPRAGEAHAPRPDDPAPVPRGQGQRVMVVDDEAALLELAADALRELGYEPATYGSAQAALDALRADPGAFAVLITDLQMPGMSGDALIREVRSECPLLPVIVVSGYSTERPPDRMSWADEVLGKPVRREALAQSLARVLDIA
jgi:CheY-like chemotaxis protein